MKTSFVIKRILLPSAFLIMFFGVNVLNKFGYMIGDDTAPGIQKIFPSIILMLFLTGFVFFTKKKIYPFYLYKKPEFIFLLFIVVFCMFIVIRGLSGLGSFVVNTMILPILFSICLDYNNPKLLKNLLKIVLCFFVINSLIAIIERVLGVHYFPEALALDRDVDSGGFRATALQGHPLNNGLITSTILAFVFISDFKVTTKYALYFLGLIAILCFGSRSSLAACTLMPVFFYFRDSYIMFRRRKTRKSSRTIIVFAILLLGIPTVYFLLTDTSFGDRLMKSGLFDKSADVRVRVFDIFNYVNYKTLLWGSTDAYIANIKSEADIAIIENFWIIWVLKYGVIFSFLLAVFFIRFLLKKTAQYGPLNRLFLVFFFILIASTNISLSTTTGAVSIFVICTYAFSNNLDQKFLTVKAQKPRQIMLATEMPEAI